MDGARLSQRERRILAEIERDLCEDKSLDRNLRSMSRPSGVSTGIGRALRGHRLALCVGVLAALTVTLLVAAVATGAPLLIWAFAAVWVLTLTGLLTLVVRWSRRLAARGNNRGVT